MLGVRVKTPGFYSDPKHSDPKHSGAIDGWYALHERFGKLPMSELRQPTIDYAKVGIPITEVDAALWADALADFEDSDLPAEMLAELYRTYLIDYFLVAGSRPI